MSRNHSSLRSIEGKFTFVFLCTVNLRMILEFFPIAAIAVFLYFTDIPYTIFEISSEGLIARYTPKTQNPFSSAIFYHQYHIAEIVVIFFNTMLVVKCFYSDFTQTFHLGSMCQSNFTRFNSIHCFSSNNCFMILSLLSNA